MNDKIIQILASPDTKIMTPIIFKKTLISWFTSAPIQSFSLKRLDALSKIVALYVPNISTRGTFFSKTRKILKERTPKESHAKLLASYTAGLEDYEKRQELFKEQIINKQPITVYADDYIDLLKHLSSSSNPIEILLATIMATGSRPVEVLSSGVFEKSDKGSKWIHISGLAKTRGVKVSVDRPIIELKSDDIIRMVDSIRKDFTNTELPTINSAILRVGKQFNVSPRQLRDEYINMSFELFADKDKITKNAWITSILGHTLIAASISYNASRVVPGRADGDGLQDAISRNEKKRTKRW